MLLIFEFCKYPASDIGRTQNCRNFWKTSVALKFWCFPVFEISNMFIKGFKG